VAPIGLKMFNGIFGVNGILVTMAFWCKWHFGFNGTFGVNSIFGVNGILV
jgi:hypothetical protein